jgi:hypothetical protein
LSSIPLKGDFFGEEAPPTKLLIKLVKIDFPFISAAFFFDVDRMPPGDAFDSL